ncbi:hypothetical protein BCR35DRAFT_315728 [Leucosporidium creatinivorum]|uniref:Uncharacterized protein n=1 Tax=Leucosporidium creatinivorum TaxID=106004 RepID=A0A1Y2DKV8_9BASI|nr:hypothetical protein BCR35DRAFT_315728 [Leucosporidium creatinivorum]
MFASLGLKCSVRHSKALCSSSSSLLIPTTASPSLRLTRIGSRFGKGRTLSLGAKGGCAEALNALVGAIAGRKDSSRFFSSAAANPTTVRTKFDLIESPDGLEHHIRDVNQLAWIGVGEGEWRLSLSGKGYVSLIQTARGELSATRILFKSDSDPSLGRKRTSKMEEYEFLRFDDVCGQTSWCLAMKPSCIAKSLAFDPDDDSALLYDAPWRQEPSTEEDVRFLAAKIATSYRGHKGSAAELCIPGGWVGRRWKEQVPVRQLKAGEATETLSRVVWGIGMLQKTSKAPKLLRCEKSGLGDEQSEAKLKPSRKLERILREYYFA